MQKVLILGGNGLIGSTIANSLSPKDYSVTIADSRQMSDRNPGLEFIQIDALRKDSILKLIHSTQPAVIINCINVATIYSKNPKKGLSEIVQFYLSIYKALTKLSGAHYIQIGTTGSGGLGLNIPFTHGEKLEDLPIIYKASFAGITTSMLTLLSRSFGDGIKISELKPGLAVFSDDIINTDYKKCRLVCVDGGESGYYSYQELALLTSFMGFTTSSHLVQKVVDIINNKAVSDKAISHFDIIANLNATIVSPESSDIQSKNSMLDEMRRLNSNNTIIATGNLGPPLLTRDLILSHLYLEHPKIKDKEQFNALLSENQTIRCTLDFIKDHNKNLSKYLRKQCVYDNYLVLEQYYSPNSEPWQIVMKKLKHRQF